MKALLLPLFVMTFAPTAPAPVVQEEVLECAAPTTQVIGEDATACKRKCNSKCEGAQNKSKCVGECRRACDK